MNDHTETAVSSLELLLQGKTIPAKESLEPLRAGLACPECRIGKLDYNGLLALECSVCGFTNNETGGCT